MQLRHRVKAMIYTTALALGSTPLGAMAGLDFQNSRCSTPGQQIGTLPNSNNRVMVYTYHNDYLISHDWGTGVMKSYDLTDPTNPQQVGGDRNPGNAGHHHFMGVGNIIGFNWAGVNQTRLDDVPYFDSGSIVDGTDEAFMVGDASNGHHSEQIAFYPYGFGSVPTAYEFDNKPVVTIHDLSQPGNPKVGEVNVQRDLGFQGRVNMMGNLLIVRGDNLTGYGVGVYDISDPANPVLLDKIRERSYPFGGQWALGRAYDTMPMYKNYIVNAMNSDTGFQRAVDIIDYSDPTNLRHVSSAEYEGPSLRYPNFKDDHMYVGEAKVDMRTFEQTLHFPWAYGEYLMPIGNLLVAAGQYRMNTARVYCNETEPDTRAPEVGWTNPRPNATNLHVKSRVGVLIHETLDINTINENNFQIRTSNGEIVPAHVSWWSNQTINVTPKAPLQPNTTYQFYMRAGGVRDIAGNALASDYSFYFSTGDQIQSASRPEIQDVSLSAATVAVGDAVQISVDMATDTVGLIYNVDWGDGEKTTGASQPTLSHSYQASGIYSVSVEVVDAQGAKATQVVQVMVESASLAQHVASSTIVYDSVNSRVLNVNPDNNTVTATHATTGQKLWEKPVGKDPRSLALDGAGNIWVSNYDDGTVSVLDTNGNTLETLALHPGAQPVGIVIAPNQLAGYVAAQGKGAIYKLNPAQRSVVGALQVGPSPYALAITADSSTLLATRFISPQDEAQVYRIRTSDFTISATISIEADKTTTDTNTSARGVMNFLSSIAIEPGSQTAWVTGKKDNVYRGMALDGNFGNFQNTVRSIIAKIDLNTNSEIPGSKFDIDNAEIASAIVFSRGGKIAYIAHLGNNRLSAYNVDDMQGIDWIEMGLAPKGVALAPNGEVYTHNFLSRTVSHLTIYGSNGAVSEFKELHNTAVVANESLPSTVLKGKRIFYNSADNRMAMDGYLACATCHFDGGSDHRVYDFTDRGEGLRNTISLIGRAGTGHGRVHWSANFDEIQDFEHDIRFAFLGTGLMSDEAFAQVNTTLGASKAGLSADLDALAAFTASLNTFPVSPYRNANGTLTDNGAMGKAVFDAKGCADCHGGEAFTDSPNGNRHDVGTLRESSGLRLHGILGGIDTPTLRGLWDGAPYLHDGSALTLADVLNNQSHGSTNLLTDLEREQLVSYLLQIDGLEPAARDIRDGLRISSLVHGQTYEGPSIGLQVTTDLPNINEVQWVVDDMPVTAVTSAPYAASWKASRAGLHRVYAKAVYNNGLTATLSPEVTINVELVNQPVELFVQGESYVNYYDTTAGNTASNSSVCSEGTGTDVDVHNSTNTICAIGWMSTSEWLDYTVTVPQAGEYGIWWRYSNGNTGDGRVQLRVNNGSQIEVETALPPTAGWTTYASQFDSDQTVTLQKGTQTIRLYVAQGSQNIDYFELKSDFDRDGVYGTADLCEGTIVGASINGDGCSGDQLGASAPAPEVVITATAIDTGVRLNWVVNNVDANLYEIYRDVDADPAGRVRIASFGDTGTLGAEDTEVDGSTTYYYWIKVRDSQGTYYNSEVASVTTLTPAPAAALSIQASASEEGVYLTWSHANINANQYEIYRDTDADPAGRVRIAAHTDMNILAMADIEVEASTVYYYWLKVRDTSGVFYNSDVTSAETLPAPAPEAPAASGMCDDSNSVALALSQDTVIHGGECFKVTSSPGADLKISTWSGGQIVMDVEGCYEDMVAPSGQHTSLGKTGTVHIYIEPITTATTFRVDSWDSASESCGGAVSSASSSSSVSPVATTIEHNVTYKIINRASGKAIDVSGFSSDDGAIVHQWDYVGGANQHWQVSPSGGGVQIYAMNSMKCLDVPNGDATNGVQWQQWWCSGNDNQRFSIANKGDGYFEIRSERTGKCFDYAMDANVPARLHQWDCHGGENQQWRFERVE